MREDVNAPNDLFIENITITTTVATTSTSTTLTTTRISTTTTTALTTTRHTPLVCKNPEPFLIGTELNKLNFKCIPFNDSYLMEACAMRLKCKKDYIPSGNGSTDIECHNGSWNLGEWNQSLEENDKWLKCEIGNVLYKLYIYIYIYI